MFFFWTWIWKKKIFFFLSLSPLIIHALSDPEVVEDLYFIKKGFPSNSRRSAKIGKPSLFFSFFNTFSSNSNFFLKKNFLSFPWTKIKPLLSIQLSLSTQIFVNFVSCHVFCYCFSPFFFLSVHNKTFIWFILSFFILILII